MPLPLYRDVADLVILQRAWRRFQHNQGETESLKYKKSVSQSLDMSGKHALQMGPCFLAHLSRRLRASF